MLGANVYNLGVIDWFRTYSLDQVLIRKIETTGVDSGSIIMYKDSKSSTVYLDQQEEVLELLQGFNKVKLKKVNNIKRNSEQVYELYMTKQYRDHREGYSLRLYGNGQGVPYLEIYNDQKTKNKLSSYKVVGGNIDLAPIEEAVSKAENTP